MPAERLLVKYHILPRGREKDEADVRATMRQYLLAQEFTSRFVARLRSQSESSNLKMMYVSTGVLELQVMLAIDRYVDHIAYWPE